VLGLPVARALFRADQGSRGSGSMPLAMVGSWCSPSRRSVAWTRRPFGSGSTPMSIGRQVGPHRASSSALWRFGSGVSSPCFARSFSCSSSFYLHSGVEGSWPRSSGAADPSVRRPCPRRPPLPEVFCGSSRLIRAGGPRSRSTCASRGGRVACVGMAFVLSRRVPWSRRRLRHKASPGPLSPARRRPPYPPRIARPSRG
jgi:hypothetical protein